MQGYRLLRQHKIPVDLLCVVHAQNVQHPLEVYRFFKEIGAQYLSFIPLVEPQPGSPGGVSERTVPAEAFGDFLCAIFDEWVRHDIGRIIVQIFEEAARPAYGLDHSLCIFRPTCGDVPVVEHNGDFYQCDHFVTPEHRLGNIRETPLAELLESPAQEAFGRAKQETLPRYCQACDVLRDVQRGLPEGSHHPDARRRAGPELPLRRLSALLHALPSLYGAHGGAAVGTGIRRNG